MTRSSSSAWRSPSRRSSPWRSSGAQRFKPIRTDRIEEGQGQVRRYLDANGTNGKAWALLSESLVAQGRISEADQAIERAMQLDPGPMVAQQAIMHYMQTGRPQLAQAIQERLQSRTP